MKLLNQLHEVNTLIMGLQQALKQQKHLGVREILKDNIEALEMARELLTDAAGEDN